MPITREKEEGRKMGVRGQDASHAAFAMRAPALAVRDACFLPQQNKMPIERIIRRPPYEPLDGRFTSPARRHFRRRTAAANTYAGNYHIKTTIGLD